MEILIGSAIAIGFTILIEYYRKPNLIISISQKIKFEDFVSLRLRVINSPLPRLLKWLFRQPALQCHGNITFHDSQNGQNLFGREMSIRWVNNPEPLPIKIISKSGWEGKILDPVRFNQFQRIDIYPGKNNYEDLDVVIRYKNEKECYGFNNESYQEDFKDARWKLAKDQYLIKVTIWSSGDKVTKNFRLMNLDPIDSFRIVDSKGDDPELL
jgi:hypothetical protein